MSRNSALDYVRDVILSKSEKSLNELQDESFDWPNMLKKLNEIVEKNLYAHWGKINSGELSSIYSKCKGQSLRELYRVRTESSFENGVDNILLKNPKILKQLFSGEKYSPSKHTLDVLAIYCGYVGWRDLVEKFKKNELQDVEKLCQSRIIANSDGLRETPIKKRPVNSEGSIHLTKQLSTKNWVILLIGLIISVCVYIYFQDSTSNQNKVHYDELQPIDTIQNH